LVGINASALRRDNMADDLDPKNPNEANEEDVTGRADEEEEFEDTDEEDSDEDDLESETDATRQ